MERQDALRELFQKISMDEVREARTQSLLRNEPFFAVKVGIDNCHLKKDEPAVAAFVQKVADAGIDFRNASTGTGDHGTESYINFYTRQPTILERVGSAINKVMPPDAF